MLLMRGGLREAPNLCFWSTLLCLAGREARPREWRVRDSESAGGPSESSDKFAGTSGAVGPGTVGGPAAQYSGSPGRKRGPPRLWPGGEERRAAKRSRARHVQGRDPSDQRRKPAGGEARKATTKGRSSKEKCREADERRLLLKQTETVLLKRKRGDGMYRETEKPKAARRLRAAAFRKEGGRRTPTTAPLRPDAPAGRPNTPKHKIRPHPSAPRMAEKWQRG